MSSDNCLICYRLLSTEDIQIPISNARILCQLLQELPSSIFIDTLDVKVCESCSEVMAEVEVLLTKLGQYNTTIKGQLARAYKYSVAFEDPEELPTFKLRQAIVTHLRLPIPVIRVKTPQNDELPIENNVNIKEEVDQDDLVDSPDDLAHFPMSPDILTHSPMSIPQEIPISTGNNSPLELKPLQILLTRCDHLIPTFQKIFSGHSKRKKELDVSIKCGECPRSFSSGVYLEIHRRKFHQLEAEEPIQAYLCDQCPKSFATIKKLSDHKRRVHEQKFKCQVCGRVLYQKGNIVEHMKKIHGIGGPLKFQCNFCDYETNRRAHLTNHMTKHSGKISFVCELCGHQSKTKDQLRTHTMHKHWEAQHQCESCEGKFKTGRELRNHIIVRHKKLNESERIKCDFCTQTFPIKRYMLNHMKSHHANELAQRKEVN